MKRLIAIAVGLLISGEVFLVNPAAATCGPHHSAVLEAYFGPYQKLNCPTGLSQQGCKDHWQSYVKGKCEDILEDELADFTEDCALDCALLGCGSQVNTQYGGVCTLKEEDTNHMPREYNCSFEGEQAVTCNCTNPQ